MKLIGELRKEKEFRQQCCRNSTKIRREKDKKVERERKEISATLFPKFFCSNSCPSYEKTNCGNAIAEIGKKRNFFFLVIVAMALPKMGKKIDWNYGNVIAENGRKKKFCCQNLGRNFKKSVTFTIFL